jgi:hypothetical protein
VGCLQPKREFQGKRNFMAGSKRRRRTRVPIEILLGVAVSIAFSAAYCTVLAVSLGMLGHRGVHHPEPLPTPTTAGQGSSFSDGSSRAFERTLPPAQTGEYSRLYRERQVALLGPDATSLNTKAARSADDWKSAGDWDHSFLQMDETLKAGLYPALPPVVPGFQTPFQVPALQIPVLPTCCAPR